jgi:hypothetical protein
MNCIKTACQKRGNYVTNIWDDVPGPSNIEPQPPTSPPILENDELVDMPDITLEEDLQGVDLPSPTPGPPETQPAQPQPFGVTVDDSDAEDDSERLGKAKRLPYYIQEFPPNLGAGAVWGEEVPFFEKLRQEQVQNGSSRWGPFDDQDEWELAQWLITNIGHNQINAFLDLNIVTSHLFNFDSDRSLMVI